MLIVVLSANFQDVSNIGAKRQIVISGSDPNTVIDVEASNGTGTLNNPVSIAQFSGNGSFDLYPNGHTFDSSAFLRFRVVKGSAIPVVWLQGEEGQQTIINLTTAFQDVSSIGSNRQILVNGNTGVVTVEASDQLAGPAVVIGVIRGDGVLSIPNDSSSFLRATPSLAVTDVWVQGDSGIGAGGNVGFVVFAGQNHAGDWARLNALMVANAYKNAIVLLPSTILADQSLLMPSGTTLIGQPGVTILAALPTAGTNLDAPFAADISNQGPITTLAAAVKRGTRSIATVADESATWVKGTILQIANAVTTGNSAGFRVSTHTIVAIAGVNINLDRPLPRDYVIGSTVTSFGVIPKDIQILGGGMKVTGPSTRYFEIKGGTRCIVENVFISDEQGIAHDLIGSFDGACYDCSASDIQVSTAFSATTPLAGYALESCDGCSLNRIAVYGQCSYGCIMYDCSDCLISDCQALQCPAALGAGFALLSDTAVRDATTEGCINCTIDGSVALQCTTGCLITDGSRDCHVTNSSFDGNTATGIAVNVAGGNTTVPFGNVIDSCSARYNTTTGIIVGTLASGTVVKSVDVDGNGTTAATGTGLNNQGIGTSVDGLRAKAGNNVHLILSSLAMRMCNVLATAAPNPAINGWVQLNGGATERYTMRDCDLSLAGGAINSNPVQTAAVLSISGTKLAANGGATVGVLTQAGGTLRIGRDNDWSGNATAYAANGGGVFSQGQVILNAVPVVVPFTDLKTTDRVHWELQALGGTGAGGEPITTRAAGVGFTATVPVAGDTDVWNWAIES